MFALSLFNKISEIIFRVNPSSDLSCVYAAHVIIKRQKNQVFNRFLRDPFEEEIVMWCIRLYFKMGRTGGKVEPPSVPQSFKN